MSAKKDLGAPSALRAIEEHELLCRNEKDVARKARDTALEKLVDDDDVSERTYRKALTTYADALSNWDEALKRLNTFDKSVVAERREGEKVLVSDVKEWFIQIDLNAGIAAENFLIGIAKDIGLYSTPEEFMKAHAELWRTAKGAAIESAIKEGVVPAWIR